MPQRDEATFVLHGLDSDGRVVRANVFVQKLRTLLRALQLSDKVVNGKPSFIFMLGKLQGGSAAATIREKQKSRKRPTHSSIEYFESVVSAIYNGDRSFTKVPSLLIRHVHELGDGVTKNFAHAELSFPDNNVIRIDDYLLRQSEIAYEELTNSAEPQKDKYYRGLAIGSFDGILKEIDARGTLLLGKIILTAGGLEIDCVMNEDNIPQVRECFDKRVIVEGTAHYDGETQLPERIDLRTIRIVNEGADLTRWRGAFEMPKENHNEEDW
jgi:hypothetical protein